MPRKQKAETALYAEAMQYFASLGFMVWRQNTGFRGGVRFGFVGQPDIAGYSVRSGKALFVECKREGQRLTSEQYDFLQHADASGCHACVYSEQFPYDFEDIPEAMKPKEKKCKTLRSRL